VNASDEGSDVGEFLGHDLVSLAGDPVVVDAPLSLGVDSRGYPNLPEVRRTWVTRYSQAMPTEKHAALSAIGAYLKLKPPARLVWQIENRGKTPMGYGTIFKVKMRLVVEAAGVMFMICSCVGRGEGTSIKRATQVAMLDYADSHNKHKCDCSYGSAINGAGEQVEQEISEEYAACFPAFGPRGAIIKLTNLHCRTLLPVGCAFNTLLAAVAPHGPASAWERLAKYREEPDCPIQEWDSVHWRDMSLFSHWAGIPLTVALLTFSWNGVLPADPFDEEGEALTDQDWPEVVVHLIFTRIVEGANVALLLPSFGDPCATHFVALAGSQCDYRALPKYFMATRAVQPLTVRASTVFPLLTPRVDRERDVIMNLAKTWVSFSDGRYVPLLRLRTALEHMQLGLPEAVPEPRNAPEPVADFKMREAFERHGLEQEEEAEFLEMLEDLTGEVADRPRAMRRPVHFTAYNAMQALHYIGPMPPAQINPGRTSWCSCGGETMWDEELMRRYREYGVRVCSCRRGPAGCCRHYWYIVFVRTVAALRLHHAERGWFRHPGEPLFTILDCVFGMPLGYFHGPAHWLQLLADALPTWDSMKASIRRARALEPMAPLNLEDRQDDGDDWFVRMVNGRGYAQLGDGWERHYRGVKEVFRLDGPGVARVVNGVVTAIVVGAILATRLPSIFLSKFLYAMAVVATGPILLYLVVRLAVIYIASQARRIVELAEYPRVVYTVYTSTPRRADYLVPTVRAGWRPFATVDKPCGLCPEGRYAEWSDYESVNYVSGLQLLPDSGIRPALPLEPNVRPDGYRIVTCVGLWPTVSPFHIKRSVSVEDPMCNAECLCDYVRHTGRTVAEDFEGRWVLLTVLLLALFLRLFSYCVYSAMSGVDPSCPDIYCVSSVMAIFQVLHDWAWVAVDGRLNYTVVETGMLAVYFFTSWVWQWFVWVLVAAVGYSAWAYLCRAEVRMGVRDFTWWKVRGFGVPVEPVVVAMIGFVTSLPYLSNFSTLGYYVSLAIAARHVEPCAQPWFRVTRAMQMAHFMAYSRMPDYKVVLTKIMTQWSRSPHTMFNTVKDAVVTAYNNAGKGLSAVLPDYDVGLLEALTILCIPGSIDCNMAKGKMRKIYKADVVWNPEFQRYDYSYKPRICARPGCGQQRYNSKWPHGLCPRCSYHLHTIPFVGVNRDYVEGKDCCGHLDLTYPGIVSIPELELPAPRLGLEPGVVMFDTPSNFGNHLPGCPLRRVDVTDPEVIREVLRKKGHCDCLQQRLHVSEVPPMAPKIAGHLYGFGVNRVPPYVTFKSLNNTLRAIACRVARLREVVPQPGAWERLRHLIDCSCFLKDWGAIKVEPLTLEEWLAGFTPSRASVLQRCAQSWYDMGRFTSNRWWRFKFFIKREWLPRSENAEEVMTPIQVMKPRGIQPPFSNLQMADLAHVVLGPATRALTHEVKHRWNWEKPIFYASVSPEELDSWINLHAGAQTWLWSDYTMFDMTHSKQTWAFLEPLYAAGLTFSEVDEELFARVLRHWRAPIGKSEGNWRSWRTIIRYFGVAMNASGRDDTALANAILNAFAMFTSLAAVYFDLFIEDVGPEHIEAFSQVAALSIVGDDSLAALPGTTLRGVPWASRTETLKRNLAHFGFMAKIGTSDRIVDAVFLGNRPYYVSGRWHWGPTIGRRAYKHHCCVHPGSNGYAWLNGIATMEARCFGFVPVLGAMARRTKELLEGRKCTAWKPEAHGIDWTLRSVPSLPDHKTYELCASAYTSGKGSISVDDLLRLEKLIMSVTELPVIINDPCLNRIMLHDDL